MTRRRPTQSELSDPGFIREQIEEHEAAKCEESCVTWAYPTCACGKAISKKAKRCGVCAMEHKRLAMKAKYQNAPGRQHPVADPDKRAPTPAKKHCACGVRIRAGKKRCIQCDMKWRSDYERDRRQIVRVMNAIEGAMAVHEDTQRVSSQQ